MKHPSITRLHQCRACKGASLDRFLHLPGMPLTDDFITPDRFGSEFLADIDVFVCRDCMTAQTQHDVDTADYYDDYQYSVGASATAGRFMRELAGNLKAKYYPDAGVRKVLEIGSGDGEQLVAFKETGCRVLGYEPSSVLCEVAATKVPEIDRRWRQEVLG